MHVLLLNESCLKGVTPQMDSIKPSNDKPSTLNDDFELGNKANAFDQEHKSNQPQEESVEEAIL